MTDILKDYQYFQKSTEKKEFDLKYMAIGWAGEVGEVLNEIKKKHDWKTVPMVFCLIEDKEPEFIGGYTDLVQYFEGTDGRIK